MSWLLSEHQLAINNYSYNNGVTEMIVILALSLFPGDPRGTDGGIIPGDSQVLLKGSRK